MNKILTNLKTVLPTVETGTSLKLTHGSGSDEITIFAHNQVWFELNQKYQDWGFLQNAASNSMSIFLALYTNYVANMGEAYWRMYDALQREYNPIENYSMIEAGADGHKQSKKTNDASTDTVGGNKLSDIENKREGTITNDDYTNAFNSDVDSVGTHKGRTETGYGNGLTDTTTYTETKSDSVGDLSVSGQTNTNVQRAKSNATEDFDNDVSISFKKTNPDGTDSSETLGSDFTDGTMYRHTRSGNIGVTTAQQMLTEELQLRKGNLLVQWVEGFIREYFTWNGERE